MAAGLFAICERIGDLIEFRTNPIHALNVAFKAPFPPGGDASQFSAAKATHLWPQLVAGVIAVSVGMCGVNHLRAYPVMVER